MNNCKGFTFIELMMVVLIIGILAGIAIPNFQAYRERACLAEGYALSDSVKKSVLEFYNIRGGFPQDNKEAGLPEPKAIKGKYVKSITVEKGFITAIVDVRAKIFKLTLAPLVNKDYPTGPVVFENKIKILDQ